MPGFGLVVNERNEILLIRQGERQVESARREREVK